ncbi:apolipoprotein N-acyltransferase [Beutenbergia cavernae DSM 12333]|uniref:Apolipoprotein N-acyltransferase n=1 Tax=Beutenbergia cavernae (strain ATCC BAA-8 / DSM 12333 / CCUG 43141 / JCM 11478 / NBRC 16432 / NCIMB 13614 / HKI 0122) TaxID=471853 RepID=C5C6B3_BEUC1|nr:apolipoprotein N-acyltransferase [Beutenbergia cavernae]ACQ80319.1 apolipoprotein N-acyltransferase [Beutenbergia cavernae DSM 12333]
MPSPPSRAWTLLLAAGGGLLTDTAFPMRSWWPFAFLGIALLALALRRDSARWAFVVGTVWGLAFFSVHLWWANDAVGSVPWVALSVFEACAVGLFGVAWAWIRRVPWIAAHTTAQTFAFAFAWTSIEQLRSQVPFGGFPWGKLAFSQVESPLLRLASIGGAPVVSAVVAALGFLLAVAWWRLRTLRIAATAGAVVVTVGVVAACLAIPLDTRAENGTMRIGAVQGNVAEPGLGAFDNAREVTDNHARGTEELAEAEGPGTLDVVVWPENAADYDPRSDAAAGDAVERAAQAAEAPILLGTQRFADDTRYNESILWEPGVGATQVYAKQRPAPFAEYIPLRDLARRFSSAVDLVTVDMSAGTEVGVIDVPVDSGSIPVGPVICFEVAYDDLVRDAVVAGAQVLVVQTNNASFGYTAESEQQLAMTRFRAVELGRTAVQISTVGVSGVATPNGVLRHETELFTPAQFAETVPLRTSLTPAARLGDVPVITMAVLAAVAFVGGIATWRRRA